KKGAYSVQTHVDGAQDEDPAYPVKTLVLGPYHFIALGPKKGSIIRYEIKGDTFIAYKLNADAVWEFITDKYPDAENIVREESDEAPLKIEHFDDDVAEALAHIPDEKEYWISDVTLVKKK